MSTEVIQCFQGSQAWLEARLGIPTASCFQDILTKGRGGAESKTRRTYMLKLIGEVLTGRPSADVETMSRHMERGEIMEAEARDLYAMLHDADPEQIGFVRNTQPWGAIGCSPDSLVGENGLLEIKTKLPHLQVALLLEGVLPDEHKAQVQGQIWVCEREWCDFLSYWTGLKPFEVRVYRDDAYIAELAAEVQFFVEQMNETIEKVKAL